MDLSQSELDDLVKDFRKTPDVDTYQTIYNWYLEHKDTYHDNEYLMCIYVWLLGANLKNAFSEFDKQQHNAWIKEIRDLIERANPMYRSRRKTYLDYATKKW